MKALVWEAPKTMNIREHSIPVPQSDEVLIKVAYAGICGSELSGYLGHNALRVPPLVMGHEFSGEIVTLGSGVQAINPSLCEGQAVTANPLDYHEPCEYCDLGLHHLSPTRSLVGAHRPGAYAEYVAVPAKLVAPLPNGMSLRMGALVEPAACAVRIGEQAGEVESKDCLIIGAGPIGLLTLQVLRLKGARRIYIADLDRERLSMGAALGGEPLNPNEFDIVQHVRAATKGVAIAIDAVGAATTRVQCVTVTRSKGTVLLSGLHEETSVIPAADIIRREIDVRGCFAYTHANFHQAIDWVQTGKLRLDPWIVEAPLGDGKQWFDRLIESPGNVSKVLLIP